MKTEMSVLDRTGDTKIIFDPDSPDEVATARETWNSLVVKKKYLAFAVKKNGDKGERITEFDPQAGKIILVPPMAGG
jgi:hypothetical protein